MAELVNIFANTLNTDTNVRKDAEEKLKQWSMKPQFFTETLKIIESVDDMTIRLAATMAYKNKVRAIWNETGEIYTDEQGRSQIRLLTLNAMLNFESQISKHFVDTVRIIALVDFPDSWPDLVELLVDNIVKYQNNFFIVHGCLSTLDDICLRYRSGVRSNDLWSEISLVLSKCSEMLIQLCTAYVDHLANAQVIENTPLEILNKIVSIFLSILSQELPDQFEEKLQVWMSHFNSILVLGTRVPDPNAESADSLFEEVTQVIIHFVQRFSEEITPFLSNFVSQIWNLMAVYEKKPGGFTRAAINFFTALASRPVYASLFEGEGVLNTIVSKTALANIALREEDIEMISDDPVQFVREDLGGLTKDTVRGAAVELLRNLASRFEKPVVEQVLPIIQEYMELYTNDTGKNWVYMDIAFSVITALSSKSATARYGATSISSLLDINEFCRSRVFVEFNRPLVCVPIVGDCFKFMVHFRNQLDPQIISDFFSTHVAERFLNPATSLDAAGRLYAAYAIERLLLIPLVSENRAQLDSQFVELATHLISSLTEPIGYNNSFILKCLYRLITFLQPETLKSKCISFTNVVMQILETAIKKITYVDSTAVHYTFEIVAYFIKKCFVLPEGSDPQYYFMLVYPILGVLFNRENQEVEFVSYGLQLASAVVESYGAICQQIQIDESSICGFYESVLKSDMWTTASNGPAFIMVVRSYVRHMPKFALGNDFAKALSGLFSKFVNSKVNDIQAFTLASDILPLMDRVPNVVAVNYLIPILNRLTSNKTPKFSRNVFVFWMRFIAVRGHDYFKNVLISIQDSVYPMCMKLLFTFADGDYRYNTSSTDKKWLIVGTLHLLRRNEVPTEHIPKFLQLGVQLIETFYATQNTVADENEVLVEGTDSFNKLTNVSVPDLPDNINFDIRAAFICIYLAIKNSSNLTFGLTPTVQSSFQSMLATAFPNGVPQNGNDFSDLDRNLEAITATGVTF